MSDYNTCQVCGNTSDYDKWYKDNLSTCRVCFVTMCKECMDNEFEECCSIPYGTFPENLRSKCKSCDSKEQDPQEAEVMKNQIMRNLRIRISEIVKKARNEFADT